MSQTRATFSFPKSKRLTRAAEFLRVKNEGKAARGALLVLGTLEVDEAAGFRAGVVTSKRVGGAVVRNRVRRRMRELFRRNQQRLRAGIWVVLIARPPATEASYRALEDEWLRLARRASILRP